MIQILETIKNQKALALFLALFVILSLAGYIYKQVKQEQVKQEQVKQEQVKTN